MALQANDDDDSLGTCSDLITSYKLSDIFHDIPGSVSVGSLLLGVFYLLNTALTLYWITTQKRSAENGIEGAARYVMFPLYMPFMWASALSDLLVGLIVLFISYDTYEANSWPTTIAVSTMWCVQHWVIEGIACLLLQYGCGMQAVRKAIYSSSVWAFFTFLCYVFAAREGGDLSIVVTFVWHFFILFFYATLWLAPDKIIFRRTALRRYSRFWALFRFVSIVGLVLVEGQDAGWVGDNVADCYYIVGVILSYVVLKPYVVYYALLTDSIWWQGVYVPNPGECQRREAELALNVNAYFDILGALCENMCVIYLSLTLCFSHKSRVLCDLFFFATFVSVCAILTHSSFLCARYLQ